MVEYGCNVANRFGFMSDDDDFEDPQALMVKVAKVEADRAEAQKKEKLAPKVVAPAKDSKPAGKENKPEGERGGRGRGRGRGGAGRPPREGGSDLADRFGESGGRGRGGRGRGSRPFRGRGGNQNTSGEEAPKEVSFEEGQASPDAPAGEGFRGRRGGRGAFRGEGRGRGGRGRAFDRQSGSDRTGVQAHEKKGGHGRGNWGDNKDELAGETEPVADQSVAPEEPEVPREKTAEELQYEAALEEFNKMKTLREFKAAQQVASPGFKVRKAGEGTQDGTKLIPIKKQVVEDKEDEIIVVRKESNKKVLNVDITFADSSRGGREFTRGRGGARGGRGGRGGNRSQGGNAFAASAEEFPALGAN